MTVSSRLARPWESDLTEGADESRLESTRQRAGRHPATRGYRCHWDAEAGVPHSTAGRSFESEGRRLLVSKDTEGKLMTIESRQAEVRRPLMAVKPMTREGQWVGFGPDRAFAYTTDTGRVIRFESTPNEWNLTVELEAPNDANTKLQEVRDIMMTEKRSEQIEKIEHGVGLPQVIKQMLTVPQKTHPFWVAGHRLVRPHERPLEPLTQTDGDETMMDNLGDDDAGETSAVKSKIQPHKACGRYPYRDWFRACVVGTGRSDAHKRRHEEQNSLLVAGVYYGFFTDGDNSEHTKGATPFQVVNVKPNMIIWSTLVQCKSVEDQAAIKETVESLNRLGYLDCQVRQ